MSKASKTFQPEPLTWRDWLLAFLIFAGTLALLLATMQMGYARDEGFYFHAAYKYIGWFEELWKNFQDGSLRTSFTQANIDKHWNYNPEHPVLVKTAFALSHKLFHDILGWLSPATAMRLPGAASGVFAVSLVFVFARQIFGRMAGVIAAGALLFQPHFFFHSHLTVFDVPIVALSLAVIYSYWRSYDSKGWAVMTGIFWGLALSTKLNAFFLPIVLGAHWFLVNWKHFRLFRNDSNQLRVAIPPIPWALVSMALLGPLLFVALWPYHWFETIPRIKWYMNFHLQHEHYFVQYLGKNLQQPPFPISYPWVMTLLTVPATILLSGAIGTLYYLRNNGTLERLQSWTTALRERKLLRTPTSDPRGTGLLLAINFLFPITLISLPNTPIFGGTKHWMPAMPFLAILCGAGAVFAAQEAVKALKERFPQTKRLVPAPALSALLGLCVVGPAIYATAHNHPYGTAYFNELAGSHRGAADLGMARQFWGHVSLHGLPYLNENAPQNALVWNHKVVGTAWEMYKREGLLRKDLKASSMGRSQYALLHQQKEFTHQQIMLWELYGTLAPVYTAAIDGVPLLSVYEKKSKSDFKHPTSPRRAIRTHHY